MVETISSDALRKLWRSGDEAALFDLRDEGPYSLEHPFFAVFLPLAQIESRIWRLYREPTRLPDTHPLDTRFAAGLGQLGVAAPAVWDYFPQERWGNGFPSSSPASGRPGDTASITVSSQ